MCKKSDRRSLLVVGIVLTVTALVAVGCDHMVRQMGGMLVSIAPVCEDTGRPPKEFVLEIAWLETHWATVGRGRSHVDIMREAKPYVASLRATIEKEQSEYQVPVYNYAETRRLPWQDGVRVGQIKARGLEMRVYCDGYEYGHVDVEEVKAPSGGAPPCRLKRFDCSTEEFSSFWSRLRERVMPAFPRLMAAWKKASYWPEQRAAIERIYRWYIARYDAAVQQKPELLKDQDAARYIATLRERLTKLTAKNGNRGSGPNSSTVIPRPSEARLQELIAAVEHENPMVRRRAHQELMPVVNTCPAARTALLKRLLAADLYGRDSPYEDLTGAALGTAKGEAAKEIVRSYREGKPKERETLRYVLGRMGREAQEAAPVLRNELNAQQTPLDQRAVIRVILASIGEATRGDVAAIAKDFSGGGEVAGMAISSMWVIGRNEWVDDRIKALLVEALRDSSNDGGEIRVRAAIALGTLGEKADSEVTDALAKAFQVAMKKTQSSEYVPIGLSLAKADPGRRRATLRILMKRHHTQWHPMSRDALLWIGGDITDVSFIGDVASFLSDPDAEIPPEAARVLEAIGRPARQAQSKLLQMLESATEAELRVAAAKALAQVADPSEVKELQRLMRIESDPVVREAIADCVKVIQLQ